ncbi:hypothetical protein PHLCEN_2v11883 [Hermanssonia centrifuga]|uniref:Uncharacterized protein n=1 Tax=Hermanssonia centrifuga TaxID=98765 RepID=A0A2R6NJ14_9APHY|nr:hypothetical protein PHLCEN_2v11883 [Hermanssonia centrifuga]
MPSVNLRKAVRKYNCTLCFARWNQRQGAVPHQRIAEALRWRRKRITAQKFDQFVSFAVSCGSTKDDRAGREETFGEAVRSKRGSLTDASRSIYELRRKRINDCRRSRDGRVSMHVLRE